MTTVVGPFKTDKRKKFIIEQFLKLFFVIWGPYTYIYIHIYGLGPVA